MFIQNIGLKNELYKQMNNYHFWQSFSQNTNEVPFSPAIFWKQIMINI